MADEEHQDDIVEEEGEVIAEEAPQGRQQLRLNFANVTPEYANFCTFAVRQGEVFMSFGKAFVPSPELKIDKQVVMSLKNFSQLHDAMGRLLEAQSE